jgi:hypothetical protein
MASLNDADTPGSEHHLIQENRKLQHEVASLGAKLQDMQHTHNRLREYVNDKLAVHHSYHPTDLPWFWQGLNAQDAPLLNKQT